NKTMGTTVNYAYVTLAVILIAIVAYFVFSAVNKKNQYPRNHIAENNIAIVDLKDQSKVHININSKLEQLNDFSSERRVALQGEAFFDIKPDENRPFIIELNEKDHVKVLGTSFNLVNTEDVFDLIVYSGKVELQTLNRSIILEKNDRVSRYEDAYIKLKNRNLNAVSWKSGILVFDETPLD
ncbi:MAG: FecR domain-containing protein, partial [Bacteroidia bacterium]|nr:FecR domain-containing protein [Bacteroidia bacterium]